MHIIIFFRFQELQSSQQMLSVILAWALALTTSYYLYIKYSRRKLPPGPFPFPIVGNLVETLLADSRQPFFAFNKLAEKYGSVFSLKLGVVPVVVINGQKALKETQCLGSINNRGKEEWMLDRCFGSTDYGLFFSGDGAWRDNRRYTHRTLRDFGFGKVTSMEQLLLEEFALLTASLKQAIKDNNGILKIENTFNAAFVNIIYSYLTGNRFAQDDPKLHELVALSNDFFSSQKMGGGVLGSYPFMKDWAPEWSGFARTHRGNVRMTNYFQNIIEEYRTRGDYKVKPNNFIDMFLQRMEKGAKHDDYEEPIFTEKNLVSLVSDMFAAGSETSANSTACMVKRFIQEPDVQRKVQAEIAREIGDRTVTLADRPKLRYTEATMFELLRADTVAPMGPRRANATCVYESHIIPKGTTILTNHYSGNMDKTVWEDPEVFRPERFLDAKSNIINVDKIASFGYGKRDCIGQAVAKNTFFMAIATFAQHFTFKVDPAHGVPVDDYTTGITVAPVPFTTVVEIRRP